MMNTTSLRTVLLAYAQRLISTFEQDLSRLSKSGVGLKKASRIPMFLKTTDTAREPKVLRSVAHLLNDDVAATFQQDSTALSIDLDVLDTWATAAVSDRHPILIVAPFGAGKSVLIATFALRLCYQLKADLAKKSIRRLFVPLPVRLRSFIGFSPKNANRRFIEFMAESQRVLTPNAKEEELLTPPALEDLMHKGWLLPLFDGFDELPGDLDGRSDLTRREVLDHIRDVCVNSFCLTSRPAAAKETGIDCQHVLQDLTTKDIVHFIATHSKQSIAKAETAFSSLSSQLQSLCRRPLLLAALCDSTNVDGYGREEQTVGSVMTALVYHCFDKRRRITRVSDAELPSHLSKLGALFTLCADSHFCKAIKPTEVTGALSDNPLFHGETECLRTIDLAVALDFGTRFPDGSVYAYKMPLVEYLIGRYLAIEAGRTTDAPVTLLHCFRRWVWNPELREILDYTFEELWNGSAAQRDWGAHLVRWLSAISRRSERQVCDCATSDDPHTPFVRTAMRWLSLDPQCDGTSMPEYGQDCVHIVVDKSMDEYERRGRATPLACTSPSIVNQTIDVVWQRWKAAGSAKKRDAWKYMLRFYVNRSGYSLEPCITRAAGRYSDATAPDERSFWTRIIKVLCVAIECEYADWLVSTCLSGSLSTPLSLPPDRAAMLSGAAYSCGSENAQLLANTALSMLVGPEPLCSLWRPLLENCLDRLSKASVGNILLSLLSICEACPEESELGDELSAVAYSAATHVDSTEACRMVKTIIMQYLGGRSYTRDRGATGWDKRCIDVIGALAERIARQDCDALLADWIEIHDRTEGIVQDGWRRAIVRGARRLQPRSAARLFNIFEARCAEALDAHEEWQEAMKCAASCLTPHHAAVLARNRIARYQRCGEVTFPNLAASSAVESLLDIMATAEAEALALQVLMPYLQYEKPLPTTEWQMGTVAAIGEHLPVKVLLRRVQEVTTSHSLVPRDGFWWMSILSGSLWTVRHGIRPEIVQVFIQELQKALLLDPESAAVEKWRAMVYRACSCVSGPYVDEIYNAAIPVLGVDRVHALAMKRADVVFLNDDVTHHCKPIKVVLRKKLILDERNEYAPDAIRRALAEGKDTEAMLPGGSKAQSVRPNVRSNLLLATDKDIDLWFSGLNPVKWHLPLRVFWCIGRLDCDALEDIGPMRGPGSMALLLGQLRVLNRVDDLPFKESSLWKYLDNAAKAFPVALYPVEECQWSAMEPKAREVCAFCIKGEFGDQERTIWTPAARRGWQYVERAFQLDERRRPKLITPKSAAEARQLIKDARQLQKDKPKKS